MSSYVPAVAPKSRNKIQSEANAYLARFFPDHLERSDRLNVIEAFDSLQDHFPHLTVGVESLPDGVEGMTWPDGRVILSDKTYEGAYAGNGRCRFTVMHEIYHGLEHQNQIQKALVDTGKLLLYRKADVPAYRDPEWQANTFASAVLMPADRVLDLIKGTNRILWSSAVSRTFGVSTEAASIRIKQLAQ